MEAVGCFALNAELFLFLILLLLLQQNEVRNWFKAENDLEVAVSVPTAYWATTVNPLQMTPTPFSSTYKFVFFFPVFSRFLLFFPFPSSPFPSLN